MKTLIAVLCVTIIVLVAMVAVYAFRGRAGASKGAFGRRPLMSAHEQKMYLRLVDVFPASDYAVLAQVSFGALLTAKEGASRNGFSQKRADFVLTDRSFKVLAVIELDDGSHATREHQDAGRDAMLRQAGYKVIRYAGIPQPEKLMSDIASRTGATRPAPLDA